MLDALTAVLRGTRLVYRPGLRRYVFLPITINLVVYALLLRYVLAHPLSALVVLLPPLRLLFSIRLLRSMFRKGNLLHFLAVAVLVVLDARRRCRRPRRKASLQHSGRCRSPRRGRRPGCRTRPGSDSARARRDRRRHEIAESRRLRFPARENAAHRKTGVGRRAVARGASASGINGRLG